MNRFSNTGMTQPSGVSAGVPGIRSLGVVLAFAAGILLAMLLGFATLLEDGRAEGVLLGLIVALGLWPLLAYLRGAVEKVSLFALAFTLPISLKFHLVYRLEHLGGSIGLRVSITDLLLIVMVAAILWRSQGSGKLRLEIDKPIFIVFCVYMGFAVVSALLGADKTLGLFQVIAYVQSFVVFVFLLSYLRTRERLRIFLAGLLVALSLQAVVTMVQVARPDALHLQFLGASDPSAEEVVGDDVPLPDVDIGTTIVGGEVQQRPSGLLIHPNVLAFYLVLSIPVAFGVWLGFEEIGLQSLGLVALALSVVALYLSLSRAGWAGTAFVGLVALLALPPWGLKLPRSKKLMLATMAGLLAIGVGLEANRMYARIVETADEAIEFRRNLANIALGMISEHPFSGVGLNSFIETSDAYDISGEGRLKKFPVHNVYLLEASETGVAGGLAFFALVLVMITRTMTYARRCADRRFRLLAIVTACGIAGFWFAHISDFVYRIPIVTTILWVQVALVFATARVATQETR